MPNCFRLKSKETGEAVSLIKVDEDMCAVLGVPVDPVNWYKGWHDTVGFQLACGKTFDEAREWYGESLKDVTDYLDTYYTPDAWYSWSER